MQENRRTAGPAGHMVPLDTFPVRVPTRGTYVPRDVKVLRMAERDISRLDPGQQRRVREVIEDLRAGRAQVEEKDRPPLKRTYTVRVTNSLRLGLYLTDDQPGGDDHRDWVVYWVGNHNYEEAERRMQMNASMDKTAEADRRGVMVALVPSEGASKALLEHSEGTEPLEDQHITLAYLGTLGEEVPDDERTRDAVENVVGMMATRYAPLNGEANGWGVFQNADDVVVALWNIPGINGLRQAIVDELRAIGIPAKANFSYTPHQTMGYYQAADGVQTPGRLAQPVKSDFMALHLHWGGEVITIPLSGVRHEAVKTAAPARGGNPDNPGQFSSEDKGYRKKDKAKSDKGKAGDTEDSGSKPSEAPADKAPSDKAPSGGGQQAQPEQKASPRGNYVHADEIPLPEGVEPKYEAASPDADYTGTDYRAMVESKDVLSEADRAAVGDMYGQQLEAGKYPKGDPRNEPEFEERMAVKTAIAEHYATGTTPFEKYPNEKDPEEAAWWSDPANDESLRQWRESGEGGQTIDLYNRIHVNGEKEPVYNKERSRLHQQILKDLTDRYADYPRNGRAVVMAGPPGAGKSTFLDQYGESEFGLQVATKEELAAGANPFHNAVVINPDDFKELLPVDMDRYEGLEENEVALMTHEESSFIAQRAANYFMSRGYDVVIDITLGSAKSAHKKYYRDFSDDYEYRVALVDGDMANSRNNAGLRYKRPDRESGKRTYTGRFLPMSLIEHNAPSVEGGPYRSKNAEQFLEFVKNEKVVASGVYDPYNAEAGFQPATAAVHASTASRHDTMVMPRKSAHRRVKMAAKTGPITEKIKDFTEGRKTEDQLVQELSEYPYAGKEACPHKPGTPEWYEWHSSDGYDPDTYDEVILAADTGLLPYETFHKINDALVDKWAVGH